MRTEDTIAAISSGLTTSGIGIIRISGPEAFDVLAKVFRPKTAADVRSYKTHTIHYGTIVRPASEEAVDECLVSILRAPHSYTTEDTAEINCHGGPYVMRQVLLAVFEAGARPAEPGEFTKRAFLGGRLDLSEAEAVMDVIGSAGRDALRSSLRQLGGSVRRTITKLRAVIMDELAFIEAALDDPEHYTLDSYGDKLLPKLQPLKNKLSRLSASYSEGRLLREGILTVICGRPNAGKSSLMNLLCGSERAIVTDLAGTTRDVLEETVSLGGITLRIRDTAGIRSARDRVEEIGVDLALENAEDADLLLAVFDGASLPDENDLRILQLLPGKCALLLINKSDLPQKLSEEDLRTRLPEEIRESLRMLPISAKTGEGLPQLEEEIRKLFFSSAPGMKEEVIISNARQKDACDRALAALQNVEAAILAGMPEDLYAVDLMDAYRALGEILGEEVGEDLIDTIFAKFCMGK